MPQSDPVTVEDHREAYRQHRARADALKIKIDLGLVNGLDPDRHRELTEEYHDELVCAQHHYTTGKLLLAMCGGLAEVEP